MARHGEGSRGGTVIGHTKSGKPIYSHFNNKAHAKFTAQDHYDAADLHEKAQRSAEKKHDNAYYAGREEDANKHEAAAEHHDAQGRRHGAAADKKTTGESDAHFNAMRKLARKHGVVRGGHVESFGGTRSTFKTPEHAQKFHAAVTKMGLKAKLGTRSPVVDVRRPSALDKSLTHSNNGEPMTTYKDLFKGTRGEGSRGGKILGHTRSGKPIYDSPIKTNYNGQFVDTPKHIAAYTAADHLDAHRVHDEVARKLYRDSEHPSRSRDEYVLRDRARAHDDLASGHRHEYTDMKIDASMTPEKTTAKKPAKKPAKKSLTYSNNGEPMTTYEDLFKSELGIEEDKILIDCPHCEHPITKGEVISKARGSSASIAHDNKGGAHHRGPASGKNTATPVRTGGKAKRHDEANPHAHKSVSDDDVEKGRSVVNAPVGKGGGKMKMMDMESEEETEKASSARKSFGSAYVQYVQTGEDEAIAQAIAEGSLGQGSIVRPPLDGNSRRA